MKSDDRINIQNLDDIFKEIEEYKPTILDRIEWNLQSIKRKFFYLKRSIEALIYWVPFIWNHRPWDHMHMVRLMEHQFKWMAKDQKNFLGEDCIESKELEVLASACRDIDRLDNDHGSINFDMQRSRMNYICDTIKRKWYRWWT